MMQNAVDKEDSRNIVGAYTFITTMFPSISPIIFNYICGILDAQNNPSIYGYLISIFIVFGFVISSVFYYISGVEYSKLMTEK